MQLRPLNSRGAASNRRLWPLFSWFFLILVCTVERESYLCGKRLSLRQVVGSRSILYGEKKKCFKEMKAPERKGGRKPGKTACWRRRLPLSRTRSSLATSPTPQRPPALCRSPGRSPGRWPLAASLAGACCAELCSLMCSAKPWKRPSRSRNTSVSLTGRSWPPSWA